MFQVMVRGKIVGIEPRGRDKTGKTGAVVELEVRQFIAGNARNDRFQIVLDQYWYDRLTKLEKQPAFITFRCSSIALTQESADQKGSVRVYVWLQGEEFFL